MYLLGFDKLHYLYRLMKNKVNIFIVLLAIILGMTACKSEFEKVRTSNDPELLLKKADGYFEEGEYQKAQTLYELIIPSYRGRAELETIYYRYAYTYYNLQNYTLAAYYFDNFAETFPTSSYREEVSFMSAYSNYQMSPTFRLDQKFTQDAINQLQEFIDRFPNSTERVDQANRLIGELRLKLEIKAIDQGRLYYDIKQYQAAIQSLENVLKDFPETKQGDAIRRLIVLSAYELATNSIITKQKERYEEVLDYADFFVKRHPDSAYWNEVKTIGKRAEQQLKIINEDVRYQVKSSVN